MITLTRMQLLFKTVRKCFVYVCVAGTPVSEFMKIGIHTVPRLGPSVNFELQHLQSCVSCIHPP